MAVPRIPPGFDFTDPDLCAARVPAREWPSCAARHRSGGMSQPRGASGFDDEGYWVVTRHADVLEVSRASDLYSSQEKTAIIRHSGAVTDENLEMQRLILLNIDPPQHTKLRRIVSRGFTPRAIGNLREALTARAERIVQTLSTEGTGDFVTDVACELPLQAIAELLGIPQDDRRKIFAWSNEMVGYDDPGVRRRWPGRGGRAHRLRHDDGGGPPRAAPGMTSSPSWSTRRSTAASSRRTSSASS